ncbi:nuclear cap-binding protein subunit 1 isoform X2 [Ricinus communis]|uniref:nuclear cap-binding protein subunit 1 isoform X2 n=1 Tax=Ricinus communis TaxID=3988 RepID=UPI0007725046|nr:nuclear cap-binding protein subunit 1 isoform X2 [Ricinus communis]|eukprot:XP_015571307.1 nuclear cap-binding protein subunit 1 [Ricinus communis]
MSSWRSLLLRIGDNCPEYGTSSDHKEHVETCFGVIRRELEHSTSEILPFLLQCAEQLPHKIPFYGTLVGLLNLENEDFVRKILENTQTNLQDSLDSGNCDRIRILLRFMTAMMCSKVLQPASLVVVFETLLSSAATTVDEEKGNPSWQARGDFYVTCILSCLPWGGSELIEQVPEEIERVMVGTEAYLSIRRHNSDTGLSFFEDDDESGKGFTEKDFLEDLWDRIQVLSSNGWKLDSVPRPHLSFEAQLVAGKSHEFAPINAPEQPEPLPQLSGVAHGKQKHNAELKYPQRIRRLNIFPANKTEDMQPIDRFIVEEYLLDVLLFLNGCRKECASYMAGLPVTFRYEYLMAETIFSQLLLLPQPPFKPTYYTLVIMDLCKALPGAFPAVVAGAVRALFEKIADLDMECRTRLILWFSHHLSNFQFIWPWEEWAYVLDLPKWAPQRVFVQEVLEREIRLSYWDKVKQSIENAPALEELLPPKGVPNFKYSTEDGKERTEQHAVSAELINKVKGRQTAREIISWVEESVLPHHGWEVTLTVVVQTFLEIGSKSFTHLITVLERYGQVIARICHDHDKQFMLIAEVSSYWKNNGQMTAIAIDRMMGYRLLSNLAIVKWVFCPTNIDQFHTSDRPWEVLRNAISKTYNRICDLRKEISSLKNSVVSAEEAAAKAKAELDAAESKLTLVDGEPVLGENPARMKRLTSNAEKTKEEEVSARDSLEAKEALLARALDENEALFTSLYKNFSNVLIERLPDASKIQTLRGLKSIHGDEMVVDLDESSEMDVDNENGRPKKSQSNGEKSSYVYNIGEKEQWCLSTLGYVKAFSRQYASEIWSHIEKLDAEVFTENAHPLFLKAVYSGLRRPIIDA